MHFISLYVFNLFSQNYSRTQNLINMQDFAIVKISIDVKESSLQSLCTYRCHCVMWMLVSANLISKSQYNCILLDYFRTGLYCN
jgi:hypothetical protein